MKGKQATLYVYLNDGGLYERFLVNTSNTTTAWVCEFDVYDPEGDKTSLVSAVPVLDDTTKVITLDVDSVEFAGLLPTTDTQRTLRWRIRVNPGSGLLSFFYGDLVLRHGGET